MERGETDRPTDRKIARLTDRQTYNLALTSLFREEIHKIQQSNSIFLKVPVQNVSKRPFPITFLQ